MTPAPALTIADLAARGELTTERETLIRHGAEFRVDVNGRSLVYTMSDAAEEAAHAELEEAARAARAARPVFVFPTAPVVERREIPAGTLVGNINGRCWIKR